MIDTKETLCVLCQNSCRRGCSWDDKLVPVPGWTAVDNEAGCQVIRCPQFVKETPETIIPDEIDEGGMVLLLEAIARRMREDYIHGQGPHDRMSERRKHHHTTYPEIRQANRHEIERWLLHGQGRILLQLSDPEEVIRMLRPFAKKYEESLVRGVRWDD